MSAVSSEYCYCATVYGVVVEAGSGNIDRRHDRLPLVGRAQHAGRITIGLQRLQAVFAGPLVTCGKRIP